MKNLERLNNLRKLLVDQGFSFLLVTKPENRRYLSGFTGSSGMLLVGAEAAVLLTDGRYEEQAQLEASGWQVIIYRGSLLDAFMKVCSRFQVRGLGFEKDHLTYQLYEALSEKLQGIDLQPATGLVEALRLVKDKEEIACITEASVITGAAFRYLLGAIHCGQSEQEVAGILEFFMRKNQGGPPAFETIVASGARGALPHGAPTEKKLERGELVVMDFGACYRGYASDFTRTVCIGRSDSLQQEVYALVKEAQSRALQAVRPGIAVSELDALAREFLHSAGYGQYFTHSLGHGLGLSVHEEPILAPGQQQVLQPGMVITIEPGVYLPGWGGIRIEDTVLVTAKGHEVLTPVTKDFLVI